MVRRIVDGDNDVMTVMMVAMVWKRESQQSTWYAI